MSCWDFWFTGTLREEKNTIWPFGYTYLLAGEKAGPEKLKKAESLGIKVISETDFYEMI